MNFSFSAAAEFDVSDKNATDDDKTDKDVETAVQFSRETAKPEKVNIESAKITVEDSSKISIASLKKNLSTLSSFIQNFILFFTFFKLKKIRIKLPVIFSLL